MDPFEAGVAAAEDPFEKGVKQADTASDPFKAGAEQATNSPSPEGSVPRETSPSWYSPSRAVPAVTRFAGAALSPTGGIPGAVAAGGAELAAQAEERLFGTRGEIDPKEIALQAGVGSLPFGKLAETVGATGRVARGLAGAAEGATLGAGYTAAESLTQKGELPTGKEALTGAAVGAAGGAVGGALSPAEGMGLGERGKTPKRVSAARLALSPQTASEEGRKSWELISGAESLRTAQESQLKAKATEGHVRWAQKPVGEQQAFMDYFFGLNDLAPPEQQKALSALEKTHPEWHQDIQTLQTISKPAREGLIDAGIPIDNVNFYLAQLAKRPELIEQYLSKVGGGTPLAVGRTLQRKLTLAEIRQHGGGLITENPFELAMIGAHQEGRLAMAGKMLQAHDEEGLIRSRQGERIPAGWDMIHPDILRAVGRENEQLMGPAEVVKQINDRLGPKSQFGQTAAGVLNSIRQFQVGTGAYHYINTGFNGVGTGLGRAFGQIVSGRPIKGISTAAKTLGGVDVAEAVKRGHSVLTEATTADLVHGGFSQDLKTVITSGLSLDNTRAVGRTLSQIAQEEGRGAGVELLGKGGEVAQRALDKISAPLMEKFIPALKAGMVLKQVEALQDKLGRTATRSEIFDIGRHMDAVYGQMASYNTPFSESLRKVLSAVIQFPGWNIGSFQLIAGAAKTPLTIARSLPGGERLLGKASQRDVMASEFALGLTTAAAIAGTVVNYAVTGKGPESLLDVFYPRDGTTNTDGTPNRMQLPNYIRDAVGLGHGIAGKVGRGDVSAAAAQFGANVEHTVSGKESLLVRVPTELWHNMDFYGRQIFDPQASVGKNLEYGGEYAISQVVPFSARGLTAGTPIGPPKAAAQSNLRSFLGVGKAPAFLSRTEAGQEIADIRGEKYRERGATGRKEFAAREAKTELRKALRESPGQESDLLDRAVKEGTIKYRERGTYRREARTEMQLSRFQGLSFDEMKRVWGLASPQEKEKFRRVYIRKAVSAGDRETAEQARSQGMGL